MSDSKKYYYLKIKEDFFESEDIKILQAMDDGYLFSDILMKLYLKSLKYDGKLMFKEHIPYNLKMISTVTGHSTTIVEKALKIFSELGLIEVLDNGAIYMLDIQNFIGRSSSEGDRKREYRRRIEDEKKFLTNGGQMSDKHPPENRDKRLENRDRDKSIDINKFISMWNSIGINKVISIKNRRLQSLKARIAEYSEEDVFRAIENIKQSNFLKGENDRGWRINFDWFVAPNNFPKVLEGNYTNRKTIDAPPSKKTKFEPNPKTAGFNNFEPREYDYDDLEKKLLGWDKDDEEGAV